MTALNENAMLINREQLQNEIQHRSLTIELNEITEENRTVKASLSSETPVLRWFGSEILLHTQEAIDLSRAQDGLPLLWNHNSDKPIGLVENIAIVDNKLRGILRFSKNSKAEEVWQDVKDGFLRNLSIGYSILEWIEEKKSDLITVTRWSLAECSIAPVPADPTVGINRSFQFKEAQMSNEETSGSIPSPPQQTNAATVSSELPKIRRDLEIVRQEARQIAVNDERKRVGEITEIFENRIVPQSAEFRALRMQAVDEGWSIDLTRQKVMEALAENVATVTTTVVSNDQHRKHDNFNAKSNTQTIQQQHENLSVHTAEDELDKFKRGVSEAFMVRAGLDMTKDAVRKAREGGFVGMRLSRIAEHYLQIVGIDTRGLNDDTLPQKALTTRANGATTSDFVNILANTANKALLMGWDQAPETWQQWVRIGQVPDFKLATRTGLSGFTSLAVVPEDGEITYGKFTDRKETIQAISYAKKFRLTYQAIKNDDLNAFTAIPRGMGRAAQSVIGDIVYAILNGTGPTLNQDSTALFNTATHKNYVASADAPSVTTLDAGFKAMALQTDPNNSRALNINPRYLLVPKALETSARTLAASQYDPGATSSTKNQFTPNPFQNRVEVVSDARLDSQTNGTTAWYLIADANRFDTVEVAFVDGIAEPYLREEQEWDTRGVEWVVGVDFGVAALDFRGMFKQKGAA